ncbi:hypothetical protein D9M71_832930 [compost metagenome]
MGETESLVEARAVVVAECVRDGLQAVAVQPDLLVKGVQGHDVVFALADETGDCCGGLQRLG